MTVGKARGVLRGLVQFGATCTSFKEATENGQAVLNRVFIEQVLHTADARM